MEAPVTEKTEATALLSSCKDLMTVIANLRIHNPLLIVLPEALNPPSTFVLETHIVPPGPLNTSGHVVPVAIPHRFQSKELREISVMNGEA
jgi:hypothetical protein